MGCSPVAVSTPAVSEAAILLPEASHPVAYIENGRVFLDPVWRRTLQKVVDRQREIAVLANAIRTEVNTQHP